MNDREGTGRSNRSRTTAKATQSTLHRLQTRGEQLLHWFPELGKSWLAEGEPGLESVLAQIRSLRGQVSRRAQATGRDLEARAERLLGDLEKQAVRGLKPLLSRVQVASHAETKALDRRIAHLEGRLGPLLDDRAQLMAALTEIERQNKELRADVSERLREIQLRLSTEDETRKELARVHEHLDALSKEHVTRGLDLGKLHDRIVRLEMRFGDLLKEQGTQLADHDEMKQQYATLARELEESSRQARAATERVAAVVDGRALDRGELDRMALTTGEIERTLKQIDLRLGDLAERHSATREELAALVARTRQLETTLTPAASSPPFSGRTDGH